MKENCYLASNLLENKLLKKLDNIKNQGNILSRTKLTRLICHALD